jgi:hypothetical protein
LKTSDVHRIDLLDDSIQLLDAVEQLSPFLLCSRLRRPKVARVS